MATYQDVALRLALAREEANMTQQDAAKYLGVTYQAVSNWERGHSKIDSLSLLKLLVFYEVDIYDFMEKCGFVFMNRVDHSDYYLSDDAREVAEAYANLGSIAEKNLVRRACNLGPIDAYDVPPTSQPTDKAV